jgi:uncharacterized cupin superfamily protein
VVAGLLVAIFDAGVGDIEPGDVLAFKRAGGVAGR